MRARYLAVVVLLCAGAAPLARQEPVTDSYFGDRITDPYRWMEQGGPAFVGWLHAQDDATRGSLAALPGYAPLARQIAAAGDAVTIVSDAQLVGPLLYYKKLAPGAAQASLYVRPLAGGAERLLVDPVALGGATTAIGGYTPSPNNLYLAYTLADGGSEEAVLHILDLRTGKTLPEAIDRARFAHPSWSPDDAALFFSRLKPGGQGADRFADEIVYRHLPGTDPARDQPVFTAASVGSALGRAGFVALLIPPGSFYAVALVNSGVSPNSEYYVTPVASLAAAAPPHWTRIASLDDDIAADPVIRGHWAWLVSFRDASNRRLVRIDLTRPDTPNAPVIVAEQPGVLTSIAAAADGLYLVYAEGGRYSLRHLAYTGFIPQTVPVPFDGTIYELATDPRRPDAVISLESWTRPADYFVANAVGMHGLGLVPPFPLDLSSLVTDTIQARAPDGTLIPVSVTHRKDLKRDGVAPALVDAYGAYGTSADAYFDPRMMPFLLRGGVMAEAHVRGGGEFGEAWHLAGKGPTKPNTWHDFIAAIGTLEAAGYTSPAKVAGIGVSAGGIMIGRTVTERPDLLAAAIMWAPVANMLRFETTEGGPANTAEFGSTATKAGYDALREMDPYSHVVPGTRYPAILITGGINDHRVPVWMPAEFAARLQAATASGKPVDLRIDFQGGHHMMGASKADRASQTTDTVAFVLQATGDPAFQPAGVRTAAPAVAVKVPEAAPAAATPVAPAVSPPVGAVPAPAVVTTPLKAPTQRHSRTIW